ncbi:MAG: nicotinamide-nucleotide adenylyltransferase [Candidatus Aenigmatarchaeota archaeon]
MKRAFFIGRFQPFHLGHLSAIHEMEEAPDIDELIIGIGSAQYANTIYNPFTADERENMIRRSLDIKKPYQIIVIDDINDYPRWVPYVKSICPTFDVVYSGNTITKQLFEEKGYEVRISNRRIGISATEIRQMMIEGGNWQDYVPEGTMTVILEIDGVKRLREISRGK